MHRLLAVFIARDSFRSSAFTMFSWFTNSANTKPVTLFEDQFAIIDYEQVHSRQNRFELDRRGCVQLCSDKNEASKWTLYYEVIYIREGHFRFLVCHNVDKKATQEIFNSVKVTLNILDKWLPSNKDVASQHLC